VDDKLSFSLIHRPASYIYAPWMMLVSGGVMDSKWDELMAQLARWLVRHLDDPALILWLAQRGGQLLDRLAWLIEDKLDLFARLEREGKTEELAGIRAEAPNAIPRPLLRILWRVLLTGKIKSPWFERDFYRWKNWLKREGMTATLRFQLREVLAPKVALKKPFRWPKGDTDTTMPEQLKQLVDLGASLSHQSRAFLLRRPNPRRELAQFLADTAR
jgi:hypothetical protein